MKPLLFALSLTLLPIGAAAQERPVTESRPLAAPQSGRHEVALFPVVPMINSGTSVQVGAAAIYGFRISEGFALQLMPLLSYVTSRTTERELINTGRRQPSEPVEPLPHYGAIAGIELSPTLGGELSFNDGPQVRFSLLINAGVGAASSQVVLRRETPGCTGDTCKPAAYGSAGVKPIAAAGIGVRVELGTHVAIRLELRDLVHTTKVSRINGCALSDLDSLERGGATGSASCDTSAFVNAEDRPLARKLLEESGSEIRHVATVFGGVSFLF